MRNLTRGYSRKDLGVSYVKVICWSTRTAPKVRRLKIASQSVSFCCDLIRRSN
jgi:hypothetical protein